MSGILDLETMRRNLSPLGHLLPSTSVCSSLIRPWSSCLSAVAILAATFGGCGGGGGGGSEFRGAALVGVDAQPHEIDAGDRTMVTTDISEVHPDGIALKYAFPLGLDFVVRSAVLTVDGNELEVSPLFDAAQDDTGYLVFFFSAEEFGESKRGVLRYELEASDEGSGGVIRVDADVDDKLIENSQEFALDDPEFQAEDGTDIRVQG